MLGLLHRSRPRTATGKFELAFCRSNLRRQSEEKMNTEVASLWLRPSSIPIPLWPVCIYNYVYLFNLRHTSPAIEREISSGGAVGRFGNEPAQAPRLVFLGGGVIFESLVGREWGSRRRLILDRPAHLTGGLLQPTSQIPGVGCTHNVRSPGPRRPGEDEDKSRQWLQSTP